MARKPKYRPVVDPATGKQVRGEIKDICIEMIDGRPQLILVLQHSTGEEFRIAVTRTLARELTRALGPHPLVEEFFRRGDGLQ